jgi:hypothetical protein
MSDLKGLVFKSIEQGRVEGIPHPSLNSHHRLLLSLWKTALCTREVLLSPLENRPYRLL